MKILKINFWRFQLVAIMFAGCAGAIRTHPDFQAHRAKMRSVAVVSAEIDFFEEKAFGYEPKTEFNQEASAKVRRALENVLAEGQFWVTPTQLLDSLRAADQDLALSLMQIKQSFATACDIIARQQGKTISVKVGPESDRVADRAQADYLIFARGKARQSSDEALARDILLKVWFGPGGGLLGKLDEWHRLSVEVGVVDGRSGQVLWYNRDEISSPQRKPLDLKRVYELCRKLLKNFL
jgi:hypothetical protein